MRRITWLLALFTALMNTPLTAQEADVLFSYDDAVVTVEEFDYVFKKNNPTIQEPTLQDLKDYLELYINFKLKVAEAEKQQIDTLPQVQRDLTNYLDQLYRSYLDKYLLDTLFTEVYERMQYDIRTRHILVSLDPNATPEDTLRAYRTIMEARKRALKGESFIQLANEVSMDEYANKKGGDIGYVTGMTLPFYNFENAVYNTPLNGVSLPIRTRLGYHIVQPTEKRPAMGTVTMSHILVRVPNEADQAMEANLKRRADSIYQALIDGAPFDSLAYRYSEDMVSKPRGGLMEPFGSGKMISAFDSTAYVLEEGEVSQPFRTAYGYHIIRKEKQEPIPAKESIREQLRRKLGRDNRYEVARERLERAFMKTHGFLSFPERLDDMMPFIDSSLYKANWTNPGLGEAEDKALFMLGEQSFTMDDFLQFMDIRQVRRRDMDLRALLQLYYDSFQQRKVLEYGLGQMYPEYPLLAQEYHDGILMFALMDKMVWNKAVEDTTGLKAYYEAHKTDHMWGHRVQADIFTFTQEKAAQKAAKKAAKWDTDKLLRKLNKKAGASPIVTVESVTVEKGDNKWVDTTGWSLGVSEVMQPTDSTYLVVRVNEKLEPMPKSLQEARGAFISDYQALLEEQWTARLRDSYTIVVKEEKLKKLLP